VIFVINVKTKLFINMKTFKDLEFFPHPNHVMGKHAKIKFDNLYGVSVVQTPYSYGGESGLYELAVIDSNGQLTYDTPITNDVLGYLTEGDVTKVMIDVQKLNAYIF